MSRFLLTLAALGAACSPTLPDGGGRHTDAPADTDTDTDTDVDTDSDSDTGPDTEDPRRDPDTWPSELGPRDRPARLVLPSNASGSEDFPVVVVLHGYSASGAIQDGYFELSSRVDERGYALIVPNGTRNPSALRFWNATDACCNFYGSDVDDVGYLLGLLDELEAAVPIDPDRIVLVGHSNGGFMAHRMACEASERLAGIASLAGATYDEPTDCSPDDPISMLQIHGTLDPTVQYAGGRLSPGMGRYPSAERTAESWADTAGCDGSSRSASVDFDRLVPGDETTRRIYTGCGGVDVQLWTMEGSGHVPTLTGGFDAALLNWLLDQERN